MTFEHVPSDYAVLKMRVVPPSGGDTLWASGYEVYDRLSKHYQHFLEGLTAKHANPDFIESSRRVGFQIHPGPRGAAENVGQDLIADHPVIRTNTVTGWKSVYGALNQIQQLNELTKQESDEILRYLGQLITNNHDLQVRHKWGVDDVAIVSILFFSPTRTTAEYYASCSGTIEALSTQALVTSVSVRRGPEIVPLAWARSHIWTRYQPLDARPWANLSKDILERYCQSFLYIFSL
jgi:hypothetical protein